MADTVNVLSKEFRTVIRKEVSFIPGAWVEFYDSVTTGAVRRAQKAKTDQNLDLSMQLVLEQIADWNFAGEDKKILPITQESLDLLSVRLLTWIANSQGEILAAQEEKKKEPGEAAA